jgi:amidase
MDRRKFFRNGSIAGLGSLVAPSVGRKISGVAGAAEDEVVAGSAEETADFPLLEATIDELQEKMASGAYTSQSITKMYLRRIAKIDKSGPALNAVIELNPDAMSIAASMDAERKAGKIRGPLHGIPVLIKDNINSADKMQTTAGSLALEGNKAAKDAYIVGKLRAAGAVLLGKTNLSEWANFRSTRSTSGWSSRGGQTKNPYLLARNPSGSSAGSGSAVSANLCAVAIGTETNGSVVSPASICGIVGIKPTVGLLSRSGIIPISSTQDTAGPMARTVKDAALLLAALKGADEQDAITLESIVIYDPPQTHPKPTDYSDCFDPNGLRGKKIGIEKAALTGHEGVIALFQDAIAVLKAQGATVVEIELQKLLTEANSAEGIVLQYEFKVGLNSYLGGRAAARGLGAGANAGVKSLADVIAFNQKNEKRAMPWFKQETLEKSEARDGLDSVEYQEALKKVLSSRIIIDDLLKQNSLDAIAAPTSGPACCIDLIAGDYRTGGSFSGPAAMAGYPHITVPMGVVFGLPVGLSLMGTKYAEAQLIRMAYAYEQASHKRVPPGMVAVANLSV